MVCMNDSQRCVVCTLCFMAGVLMRIQFKKSASFSNDQNSLHTNSPISLLLHTSNKVTVHNLSLQCTFLIFCYHLRYLISPTVPLSISFFSSKFSVQVYLSKPLCVLHALPISSLGKTDIDTGYGYCVEKKNPKKETPIHSKRPNKNM